MSEEDRTEKLRIPPKLDSRLDSLFSGSLMLMTLKRIQMKFTALNNAAYKLGYYEMRNEC